MTAEQIIDGYQQLIRRAHSKGVRIIGGTLTPFKGAGYYYTEGEQKRQQVNEFIRTSGAFDGVVDFDKAIRDPDDPKQILPKYDSGDKLHPNDAGYQAMAEAIDLSLFQGRGRSQ
ncbi:GDSL-type esterase/lipase family protein [Natrinema gelatinilyticum]|uniref:GDSL-type esterase/lipase family protein n=1 Tax=Natrinema gelatinilyticum TaxID=2961571 RepID=UPI0030F43DBD